MRERNYKSCVRTKNVVSTFCLREMLSNLLFKLSAKMQTSKFKFRAFFFFLDGKSIFFYLREQRRIYQSRGKIPKKKKEVHTTNHKILFLLESVELPSPRSTRSRIRARLSRRDEKRRFQSGLLAPAKDNIAKQRRPTGGRLGQHAGFKAGRLIALPYTFIFGGLRSLSRFVRIITRADKL